MAEQDTEDRNTGAINSRLIYRHTLPVRLMHWINVLCLLVLLLSGFQIFNARPELFWGNSSNFNDPLLSMLARRGDNGNIQGVTSIFGHSFNTTGFLGASSGPNGQMQVRGFPSWLTIPGARWLAMGRRWHFFFAWLFVINGLAYVIYAILSRHISRDLTPTRTDWRGIGRSIVDHALLRHPHGEAARRYNILQKLTYLIVIFIMLPLMILMGLAMSPHMDSVLGWLLDLVGGRQSARTIHFVIAMLLIIFVLIHIFEVIVTGVWNNMRSMVTGRYRIDHTEEKHHERD